MDESREAASAMAVTLARRLAALPEPAMREAALVAYVTRTDAEEAAAVLDIVHQRGKQGGPPFNVALLALARVLTAERLAYARIADLYAAARAQGREGLGRLFFSASERVLAPSDPERNVAPASQSLTLGHRKCMARTGRRDLFDRLLLDPEVPVVRELLCNPRLTETDVVRLAARRPLDPGILRAIFSHPRWLARYAVKRALVLNPCTPSDLSVRILALLKRPDLRLVSQSGVLPDVVRAAATQALQK